MKLSKIDIATRELNFSIKCFFASEDPVSIHVVAASAQQILRDLCRAKKIRSFLDDVIHIIKPEKRTEVLTILKRPYNFMKHADRDSEEHITFYPAANQYVIWESIEAYDAVGGTLSGLMLAFRGWFYASHPNFLIRKEDQDKYSELAKEINVNDLSYFLELAEILESRLSA